MAKQKKKRSSTIREETTIAALGWRVLRVRHTTLCGNRTSSCRSFLRTQRGPCLHSTVGGRGARVPAKTVLRNDDDDGDDTHEVGEGGKKRNKNPLGVFSNKKYKAGTIKGRGRPPREGSFVFRFSSWLLFVFLFLCCCVGVACFYDGVGVVSLSRRRDVDGNRVVVCRRHVPLLVQTRQCCFAIRRRTARNSELVLTHRQPHRHV